MPYEKPDLTAYDPQLTKVKAELDNRMAVGEATLKYHGDRISSSKHDIATLGEKIIDLNAQLVAVHKELRALRDALSIREAGAPRTILLAGEEPLGPDEVRG